MIIAARIQVPKSIPSTKKSTAANLVASYDNIMRKHGINMLWWTIRDYDTRYAFLAYCPGDFLPEVVRAREFILGQYDGINLNGLTVKQTVNDDINKAAGD